MARSNATPYAKLDADRVHETIVQLRRRVSERFPGSGLSEVAAWLEATSANTTESAERIARPHGPLRAVSGILALAILGCLVSVPLALHELGAVRTLSEFVQVLEPALGSIFFIGAILVAVLSLEVRIKRRRTLEALHKLRALAHVVDMHQLTKDPEVLIHGGPSTPSSPERTLTLFELSRYFDYCVEMLSLTSKLSTLYVQDFHDPVAVNAVDKLESLTTGLARKVWQKAMVLDRHEPGAHVEASREDPASP